MVQTIRRAMRIRDPLNSWPCEVWQRSNGSAIPVNDCDMGDSKDSKVWSDLLDAKYTEHKISTEYT